MAESSMQIGDKRQIIKTAVTGAVAMAVTFTAKKAARLISVSNKFNAAPTTSENYTITLDANTGAAYDVTLYTVDPSISSLTSVVWLPDNDIILETGDKVTVSFTNTDTKTYGVQITVEEFI